MSIANIRQRKGDITNASGTLVQMAPVFPDELIVSYNEIPVTSPGLYSKDLETSEVDISRQFAGFMPRLRI
jgi:hypothetical protein